MRQLVIIGLVVLAGCASSTGSLQVATASSIGGNLSPDRVVISNVDRGILDVHWSAVANGRTYTCSADDMVRRPYCVRQ